MSSSDLDELVLGNKGRSEAVKKFIGKIARLLGMIFQDLLCDQSGFILISLYWVLTVKFTYSVFGVLIDWRGISFYHGTH